MLQLEASVTGFGISIINDTPQELLYATITRPRVSVETSIHHQKIECCVDTIQIDNQLPFSHFPVFLTPTSEDEGKGKAKRDAFLRFSMLKQLYGDEQQLEINDTNHFRLLSVQANRFSLNAEGEIIVELVKLKNALEKSLEEEKTSKSNTTVTTADSQSQYSESDTDISRFVDTILRKGVPRSSETRLFEPPPSALQSSMICFDDFAIQPISARVNFGYVPGVDYSVLSSIISYTGRRTCLPNSMPLTNTLQRRIRGC